MNRSKPNLLEGLMATLHDVESSTEWSQDDVEVVELKRILQRRIDQELVQAPEPEACSPVRPGERARVRRSQGSMS